MSDVEERRSRRYPGLLGMTVVERRPGYARAEMDIVERHLRPHTDGVHAGAVVSLADTACGVGCQASLPDGRTFITLELKANLIAAASHGRIVAEAMPVHMGSRTHVWEARVAREDGRLIALFTCTQLILDSDASGDAAETPRG